MDFVNIYEDPSKSFSRGKKKKRILYTYSLFFGSLVWFDVV